ncbi:AlkZ-related protein [Cytobacillus purgationiresistens]|uniref:Uncharacterized protein n=1 Tax=Cytobacillus purgationiresistens TaxID=863449 RepID=A0ABU0AB91_9BACI|nr:hypothetical protein [Cytobacillus purgationiresistens]MDQ0268514.1 hypothetical protein [Cytobacillus purgationiresistens]
MEYKIIKTYEEAVKVIEEVGLLPLSPLIPHYPSLNTITSEDKWHSETEYDPWIWRTKFSTDGIAGYGKFIKKKSVLVSRDLLPYVKTVLGYQQSVEERYYNGHVSKEAFNIYKIISREEVIDTRELRTKGDLRDKEKKKIFDNALIELQSSMDIVISGIQEKKNDVGEVNGWSSTAFETYDTWTNRNNISTIDMDREDAKKYLSAHFQKVCDNESIKKLEKIFA